MQRQVLDGAIAGAIAGSVAKASVGFKEGVVGGALGGILNNGITYGLNKAGVSPSISSLVAFGLTALADIGGLHSFGTTNNTLIPYKTEDDMYMHHAVFYSALVLSMVGLSAYRNSNFSLFAKKAPVSQQTEKETFAPQRALSR